ncbi:BON domain-containing protein [Plantactinospora sp. B6F1]|uniref:BON domain-containing protein n=1 Tax=Plantactinospora sp. B6F1 TaxID=3158971 RepID=UPI00102D1485
MASRATSRSDDEIQRDILAELAWEPRVQPNDIGVTVQAGVVTLRGWVDNYAKKWAAERAAHRVQWVRAVANDLEVRLPSSARRPDPDIAAAVTRALDWDAFVPTARIDVTVSNGWVVLRGEVEWEYQRRATEQAVRRLAGVRGLTNGISVDPRERPELAEISERIHSALVRSVETDAAGIDIRIEGGDSVVLTGNVRSWLERDEAERVAWSAPGVTNVDNHITVRL